MLYMYYVGRVFNISKISSVMNKCMVDIEIDLTLQTCSIKSTTYVLYVFYQSYDKLHLKSLNNI